jgi:hypothetical protein
MDKFYHFIAGLVLFKLLSVYFEINTRKAVLIVFYVALLKEIHDFIYYGFSGKEHILDIFFTMVGTL